MTWLEWFVVVPMVAVLWCAALVAAMGVVMMGLELWPERKNKQ